MSDPQKKSRKEKSLATRRRIFDATYELVNEKGFQYTVQDVCEKADVSVGSFYHFYPSKEAVTCDLYIFFEEHMKSFLSKENGDPEYIIHSVIKEMMSYSISLGVPFLRLSDSVLADNIQYSAVPESVSYNTIKKAVEDGAANGIFCLKHESIFYARLFITLFRGTLHWWTAQKGNFDPVELIDSYISDYLDLIKL